MLGDLPIDDIQIDSVIESCNSHSSVSDKALLIVTPNLANVAIYEHDQRVREAYSQADLILADGWPLQLAAKKVLKRPLSLVPGSELLPNWLRNLNRPTTFLLLGGKNGLATSQAMYALSPFVKKVFFDDTLWGTGETDFERLQTLLSRFTPDALLLLLGSPKQEVLALAAIRHNFRGIIFCGGASGDFLAGLPKRAPKHLQRLRLEWLYRIGREPARLAPRYVKSVVPFIRTIRRQSSAGNLSP